MSYEVTYTDTYKPALSDSDCAHLVALGLAGSTIKGMPYRTHLKSPGDHAAICGKAPGKNTRSMSRAGWYVFASIEGRGRPLCEACLKAAETLTAKEPNNDE